MRNEAFYERIAVLPRVGVALFSVVLGIFLVATVEAQTATALKSGEQTTGLTKQCYYTFAGSDYTKTVKSYELCPVSLQVKMGPSSTAPSTRTPSTPIPSTPKRSNTATAFKTGEKQSGLTKQCFYSFAGQQHTKTVQSYQLCPLSLQVRLN